MYYAGIGSRETPEATLRLMAQIADWLRRQGFSLRSGGAKGADRAFEAGAGQRKQIYYAADGGRQDALELAKAHHPAWGRCSDYARKLHARNGLIILGSQLNDPVKFAVCWTKDGQATGGTGQALRLCAARGIPVFNLFFAGTPQQLHDYALAAASMFDDEGGAGVFD